jgi:hypothetical protein
VSEQKPRHIGIAIPCQDQVDTWFMHDLVRAMTTHAYAFPEDTLALAVHQTAFLAEARNQLVKGLIEDEHVDYVIFLDSDMRFPPSLIHDLVHHDLPVVAANCAKRRRPISATARKENPADPSKLDAVWPDHDKKEGLEKIAVVGTAVMCIKTEVFFQIEFPWFHTPWHVEDQKFVGEDLYFCAQLKSAGVPLYIDHAVSWHVGHIGQYTYRMEDVLAEREMARLGMWDHLRKPEQETVNGRELIKVAR